MWIGHINYLKILKTPHSTIFLDFKGIAASLRHVAGAERFFFFFLFGKAEQRKL